MPETIKAILFVPYLAFLFTIGGQVAFMSYDFIGGGAKTAFGAALGVCLLVFVFGWRQRKRRLGKILLIASVVVWEILGVVALAVSG